MSRSVADNFWIVALKKKLLIFYFLPCLELMGTQLALGGQAGKGMALGYGRIQEKNPDLELYVLGLPTSSDALGKRNKYPIFLKLLLFGSSKDR